MTLTTFTSRAAAALVAAVAGSASYVHIRDVATHAGEHPGVAAVLPLAIDGLILVATLAMLDDKRNQRRPRMSARVALVFGIAATLAANVASAQPTVTARLVAAVPAVSFLLAVEVLARSGKPLATVPNGTDEPAPVLIEPANAEVSSDYSPDISTSLSHLGQQLTDPREAAREAYRQSVAAGDPLSGAELARRFGKSARWGVDRVAEVRKVNGNVPEFAEVTR